MVTFSTEAINIPKVRQQPSRPKLAPAYFDRIWDALRFDENEFMAKAETMRPYINEAKIILHEPLKRDLSTEETFGSLTSLGMFR